MPRRKSATSITAAIGKRINLIRKQRGFTLARVGVQDEDDRGNLKGHLSNIERGLVAPTVPTLRKIAAKVGVDLPYLVTFPEESKHQALIERTRFLSVAEVDALLKKLGPVPVGSRPPRKRRRQLRIVVTCPRRAI
jgi:transcriptional regulator with XRE-family HTH domain